MPADPTTPSLDQLLAHRAWLRRLSLRLTSDPNQADDLEQEVWLHTLRNPPRHRRGLRGWLATVMRNAAKDEHRKVARRERHEERAPSPRTVRSPAEGAVETDAQRWLASAVLGLPPPYRQALLMRYLSDLPLAEIAERLDVPVETVRTRLRRSLAKLRARLDQEVGDWRAGWLPLLGGGLREGASTAGALAKIAGGTLVGAKSIAGLTAAAALVFAVWFFALRDTDAPRPTPLDEAGLPGGPADQAPALETPSSEPGLRGSSASRVDPASHTPTPTKAARPTPAPPAGHEPGPGRVVGRVTDAAGEAVAGARVTIERIVAGAPKPMPPGYKGWVAPTRSDGWFRFVDLQEGRYLLRISAPGRAPTLVHVQGGADPVDVALEGEHVIAGFLLVGPDEEPIAQALVTARLFSSPTAAAPHAAWTDEAGHFRIGGLEDAEYQLSYGSSWQSTSGRNAGETLIRRSVGPIRAGSEDVRLHAERGEVIAGRIVRPDGSGLPVAAGAPPKESFTVQVRGTSGYEDDPSSGRWGVTAAWDGTFRIRGLPRGRYTLSASPVTATGGEPQHAVAVVEGIDSGTEDLVITLREGVALRIRVLDDEDQPVTGNGYVWVHPTGGNPGSPGATVFQTDKEGRCRTPQLDPTSTFTILVSGYTGYMQAKLEGVHPGRDEIVLHASRARSIQGLVVDREGKPVPAGVGVRARAVGVTDLTQPGAFASAYTRDDGSFTVSQLTDHEYELVPGGGPSAYVLHGAPLRVRPGAKDVRVTARKGVRLEGRLVDAEGRPVRTDYLAVSAVSPLAGLPYWTSVKKEDGSFILPGVPEGKLHFSMRRNGEFIQLGVHTPKDGRIVLTVPE